MGPIESVRSGELERVVVVGGQVDEILILNLAGELGKRIGELEVGRLDPVEGTLHLLNQFHLQPAVHGTAHREKHGKRAQFAVVYAAIAVSAWKGAGRT